MGSYKHLPTLTQLRHLVALSEHQHFGRAAESCLITQSSLSASIRELEHILGERLVERTKRQVMMAPLGQEVVERARIVIQNVEDIQDLVSASAEPLSRPIRLGMIPTIAPFLLPRVLPELRRAYPDLQISLREARSAALIKQLADGGLDLLVLAFPYPVEGLEPFMFAEDQLWIAFPPGHPFRTREHLTYTDLEGQEILLLDEGNCLRDHALAAIGGHHHQQTHEFHASSLHTLVQLVDNGLGLAVLPKMAIDTGIVRSSRVQVRPLLGKNTSREIGLVWRKSTARAADFELLAGFFRDELATPLSPLSPPKATLPLA